MKKMTCLMLAFLLIAGSLWAQDAQEEASAQDAQSNQSAQEVSDNQEAAVAKDLTAADIYQVPQMMVGVDWGADYFFGAATAKTSTGVFMKVPFTSMHGIQLGASWFTVPIDSYQLNNGNTAFAATSGDAAYVGVGTHEYVNYSLSYLFYVPDMRNVQIKFGLEYYQFIRGGIAYNTDAGDGTTTGNACGTLTPICYSCMPNIMGLNLGVNLDIPLNEKLAVVSSVGTRFFMNSQYNDDNSHGSREWATAYFRIGLGYNTGKAILLK